MEGLALELATTNRRLDLFSADARRTGHYWMVPNFEEDNCLLTIFFDGLEVCSHDFKPAGRSSRGDLVHRLRGPAQGSVQRAVMPRRRRKQAKHSPRSGAGRP